MAAFLLSGLAPRDATQLVTHGGNGEPVNGHYEQINNMLLNKFFNEHKKVHASEAIIARQQKGIEVVWPSSNYTPRKSKKWARGLR